MSYIIGPLPADSDHIGRECEACKSPFNAGDVVVMKLGWDGTSVQLLSLVHQGEAS